MRTRNELLVINGGLWLDPNLHFFSELVWFSALACLLEKQRGEGGFWLQLLQIGFFLQSWAGSTLLRVCLSSRQTKL
jgi:hypothetical protein